MRTIDELEAAWAARTRAPDAAGVVRLLCVRKGNCVHDTPDAVEVTAAGGVGGDRWANRRPGSDPDGATAVTLINAAVAELVSDGELPLHAAGDNLVVDFDISVDALPPGSRLSIGSAILRVSEQPHTGCSTFRDKFGLDALKWVSTAAGRADRLRGVNCSVVRDGTIHVGDLIAVLERTAPPRHQLDEAPALS